MDVEIYKDGRNVGCVKVDMNEFGHELCVGLRNGLFGTQSDNNTSIKDENYTSFALREVAEAINNLAQAIKEKK